MLATYTAPKKTPFGFGEASDAMRAALRDKLGKDPTREVLALALAKTALETGRWQSIWNANWGNVKAGEQYVGQYTCILLNEVLHRDGKDVVVWFAPEGELVGGPGSAIKGVRVAVPSGHPQTRMRAYANRFDGAFSYVDFVGGGHYAAAWQRLLAGDAAGYVHALKLAGYFTADEATYARTVVSLHKEFLGKLAGQNPGELVSSGEICEALACVGRDGETYLHTEAVLAAMSSMDGVWDAIDAEKRAAMLESES
ncbi:MAG TPA: hypothetical protein VL494_13860 [Steroidobacteraceae bacterium]|jgi:hypothetical protein|nr:hypothetical protein [Steroidobacteraceae bacterium]